MRSLCREALRSAELGDGDPPPDPFDPAEVEAFMGWLSAPAGGPRTRPLSPYLLEVHRANPYLQSAFRLTSGPEVDAYVKWIIRWGSFEHQIPDPLVPQAQPTQLTFDPEWARI